MPVQSTGSSKCRHCTQRFQRQQRISQLHGQVGDRPPLFYIEEIGTQFIHAGDDVETASW